VKLLSARSLALATALAVALAAAPSRADDRNGYVVLKGGGYFPTATNAWEAATNPTSFTFQTGGDVELGVGGAFGLLGVQADVGYLWSSYSNVQVTGVPVTAVLQLRIPIFFVVPYLEAGVGIFVSTAKNTSTSENSTKTVFMAPLGGGVDFLLGPILLGVEARYLYISSANYDISSSVSTNTAKLGFSGVSATLNVGYRF